MKASAIMLTDLDGTLLASDRTVSEVNRSVLALLGKKKIVRVAATGRSLYSCRKVIPEGFPFDYLIFSSGAGIMNWKTGKILKTSALSSDEIRSVAEHFLSCNLDFSIHQPIPHTHRFHWFASSNPNRDFLERLELFKKFASTGDYNKINSATQLLAVTENLDQVLPGLRKKFADLNIIRTTSPLNRHVTWIEVFPGNVSKGHAAEWLSRYLDIEQSRTMSVGNDFNDLSMLEWTRFSYIMQNAATELKSMFRNAPSNDDNGFSFAVLDWLKHLDD
ncbi:MAG: Cof-type HAD-IIB family hydrolase [Candidatus Rifleibacteriota bacterium]